MSSAQGSRCNTGRPSFSLLPGYGPGSSGNPNRVALESVTTEALETAPATATRRRSSRGGAKPSPGPPSATAMRSCRRVLRDPQGSLHQRRPAEVLNAARCREVSKTAEVPAGGLLADRPSLLEALKRVVPILRGAGDAGSGGLPPSSPGGCPRSRPPARRCSSESAANTSTQSRSTVALRPVAASTGMVCLARRIRRARNDPARGGRPWWQSVGSPAYLIQGISGKAVSVPA